MTGEEFNQDYYERGLEMGISAYSNYRWIPELTIPMAMTLIDFLGLRREQYILDFGCAKGFLVKALRMLHRQAWGYDISQYAVCQAPNEIVNCIFSKWEDSPLLNYDVCIAKDVFEHIEEGRIGQELSLLSEKVKLLFAVIPLGDDKGYIASINNVDSTHRICQSEKWWAETFEENNWRLTDFYFRVPGIKDNYSSIPESHGFFILERRNKNV